MLKRVLPNVALSATVLLCCFAALELGLRSFYPKYQNAANSSFERDVQRIVARKPYGHSLKLHPDRKVLHRVRYNNHGMAHSGDLEAADLDSAVVVGIFGDSFIENLRIRWGYPLSQVLEFLLQQHDPNARVLNFGVDGYGLDQSFLYYKHTDFSEHLRYVFYFACLNDVRNLYENQLFALDAEGTLLRRPLPDPKPFVQLLAGLHTTYLAIDGFNRLFPERRFSAENIYDAAAAEQLQRAQMSRHVPEEIHALDRAVQTQELNRDAQYYSAVYTKLLSAWQELAKDQGAALYITLLPRADEQALLPLIPAELHVLDLLGEVRERLADYDYAKDAKFQNDDHWDERGNLMAALLLYQEIIRAEGLHPLSAAKLRTALQDFYSQIGPQAQPKLRNLENFLSPPRRP